MQRISWGGVCIPWRWNEFTFRLFFLQNDSGVFWIHKGGKEVRTRSVYHDQERKNPADRWRVSWISMKNWELLFIWKGCPVMPEPLQKPVRLQMAEDICGIIRKMNKGVLPGWISILWSMNKYDIRVKKSFAPDIISTEEASEMEKFLPEQQFPLLIRCEPEGAFPDSYQFKCKQIVKSRIL